MEQEKGRTKWKKHHKVSGIKLENDWSGWINAENVACFFVCRNGCLRNENTDIINGKQMIRTHLCQCKKNG